MIAIQNATIYTPSLITNRGTLLIESGRIQAISAGDVELPSEVEIIDAKQNFLVPGFIDLQLNGAFGHDFTQEPESVWEAARQLPIYGVTAFLPTIITSPPEHIKKAQSVISQPPPFEFTGATPLGLHLEGPFINPGKKGAHNPEYIRQPDSRLIESWTRDNGVLLATVAPELQGALKVIQILSERNIVVSAGHSEATFTQTRNAIKAGLSYGTHLFNAMSALHHRQPGLIGALLDSDSVTIGVIPDGIHMHPALIRFLWKILGKERLNLVTDSMAALGRPPGTYSLGDNEVNVSRTSAQLPGGILAGSILSLDQALRNLIAYTECSLEEALPTITCTSASVLGLDDHKGRIAEGYDADMVLLTPDLEVILTMVAGNVVYQYR